MPATITRVIGLYPDVPVFRTDQLAVGDNHQMQVMHAGAPDGQPVLLLHGGPGSGQSPLLRRGFDPRRFHVIAPDQRGAGGSQPAGETAHNTLPHLLADLHALRAALQIERWLVVGGSWGATLALAHAADEPQAVSGLLLRASFLARPADITDFFDPSGRSDTTAWQALAEAAGVQDPSAMAGALAEVLSGGDRLRSTMAALAWRGWEQALAGAAPTTPPAGDALATLLHRYRLQAHWLAHGCWMQPPLLQRVRQLPATLPTLLLHADNDSICPPAGVRALHAALPQSQLRWAPGAGHDPAHPAMAALQRHALDHWAAHGRWPVDAEWPPAP